MPAASDQQMQVYCDSRIRVRAEALRAAVNALHDDLAAIDAVYERAATGAPWADARTDGPPKLLAGEDVLVFNAVANALLKCIDGTATAADITTLSGDWQAFQAACVRPV